MGSEGLCGWEEGWASVLVEEDEGGKSRGEEKHGVTQVMKDWEGADVCLELDAAGPYGQMRTPSSKKPDFLWRWFKLCSVLGQD